MAIIKADAYGHGLVRIARALTDADAFGVACMEEAQALRDAGIDARIVLLEGPFSADELQQIDALGIDMVLHHESQLTMLEQASLQGGIRIWLKIDTGMHRLGFQPADVAAVLVRLRAIPALTEVPVLVTHLANANENDDHAVAAQLACFSDTLVGVAGERCIANSAAILSYPETHTDWIRPGLMLYGISPFAQRCAQEFGLRPVMTLKSQLIAVRRLTAGETVGYGKTWTCPEAMTIGVVAIGYGDGYPRHCQSGTPVLIKGLRAQLIGRPSMDMLTVDLRSIPDPQVGDEVTLWGEGLPAEEIAPHADTIPYELLCNVGRRAQFIIRDDKE
jgi:alanine racemase